MRLKDRVAIVTGAGSGLGAGIARRFAEEGAHVVLADLNGVNADSVAEEIRQGQAKAIAVEMDVTDYDAAGDLIARTVDEYGTIDILVNSAGTSRQNVSSGSIAWITFISTILFPILSIELFEGVTTHIWTGIIFGFLINFLFNRQESHD